MLQLILSGLLVFATTTEAIYTWDSPECQALNSQDQQGEISSSPGASLLLFSAHISNGKGKYLNQTGFFLQNLPRNNVYVI